MGRITVFVSTECTNSQLVRNIFLKYAIPFQEINVDTYPPQRALMIKLTNCLITPQVLFNEEYIGGATAVTSLLKQYDQESQTMLAPTVLERISSEVLEKNMSSKDEIMLEITAVEEDVATSLSQEQFDRTRIYDIVQVTEEVESHICKITRDLLNWLHPIRFIKSLLPCNDCFSGSEAINTFMKHYNLPSFDSAISFGQTLLRLGIIHQVNTGSIGSDTFVKSGYFRLQPLKSPGILNSFRIWTWETGLDQLSPDPKPILTLSRLFRQMAEIITSATSDKGIIDYYAAQKNPRFRDFEEAVCQLQLMDPKDMDTRTKKTFFINIYNLMATHAFVKLSPKNAKNDLFHDVYYNVGGLIFSLEDIYHGILRSNSKHPKSHTKMFSESDPRAFLSLQEIDARIHFALNNRNNARLYEYHVDAIDEELRIVAELYCKSNERVDISGSKNEVIFPKFMRMFLSDFTNNWDTRSLPAAILKYLRMDSCRFLELDEMLERENKNNHRVNVIFKDKLTLSQKRRLRRVISRPTFLEHTTPTSKKHSPEYVTKAMDSPKLPLRCIHAEKTAVLSLVSQVSNQTWDCTPELSSKHQSFPTSKQSIFLDVPINGISHDSHSTAKASGSKPLYPSYQVNAHKNKPEDNLLKKSSEFMSSDMPTACSIETTISMSTSSSSTLILSSRSSKSEHETYEALSINDDNEKIKSLYFNVDNESTIKTSSDTFYDQAYKYSTESKYDLSVISNEFSVHMSSSASKQSIIQDVPGNNKLKDFQSTTKTIGSKPVYPPYEIHIHPEDHLPKKASEFTLSDTPVDSSIETMPSIFTNSSSILSSSSSKLDIEAHDMLSISIDNEEFEYLYRNMDNKSSIKTLSGILFNQVNKHSTRPEYNLSVISED